MTHLNWVIIGWGNGFPPVRWQAITSTNAALLSIRPQQTYFKENIFENQKFPIMKIDTKCCLQNGDHVINNVSIVAGEWTHQCLVASVSMDLLIYHITLCPVYKYSNAHIIVHRITLLPFGTGNTHIKLDLFKYPNIVQWCSVFYKTPVIMWPNSAQESYFILNCKIVIVNHMHRTLVKS